MRPVPAHKRAALRAIGPGVLLAMSIGLSGCAIYDEYGVAPEVFCGYLYDCGNHGGSDDNEQSGPPDVFDSGRGSSSSNTPLPE
jgi:hypothetical protein